MGFLHGGVGDRATVGVRVDQQDLPARSPGARAYYDQQRARGATHHQALRALANRLVGILHGCLRHRTSYDERKAWSHRTRPAAA